MKYLLFITINLCTFALFSQESIEQKLSPFDELIIQGRFTADLEYSNEMRAFAVVHGENVDLDNLSYSYSKKTLKVKYSGSLLEDVDLNITIRVNHLLYLEAKQGAEIRVAKNFKFSNDPISLKSDSGGKIAVHANVPAITADITKGGSIRISGKTKLLDASIRAGGTIGAADLNASKVNAEVSFGGEIICAPEKNLDAKVTSGGTISYTGEPDVKEKTRLGGTIEAI